MQQWIYRVGRAIERVVPTEACTAEKRCSRVRGNGRDVTAGLCWHAPGLSAARRSAAANLTGVRRHSDYACVRRPILYCRGGTA
jgi:hypothetical protein